MYGGGIPHQPLSFLIFGSAISVLAIIFLHESSNCILTRCAEEGISGQKYEGYM